MVVIIAAGTFFFVRGRSMMEDQLKDKLQSTAMAAAMQFNGDTIGKIKDGDTTEQSAALRDVVEKLQSLRRSVTNIRFAYIMRRTKDPTELAFVADADLALTPEELDRNKNGMVDSDEEASSPGELYDISDFPKMSQEAFLHATVDDVIGSDQWGPIISGYAPIRAKDGTAVAILGIDMSADEYVELSQSIFSPVALLLIILTAVSVGGSILLFLWQRRLEAVDKLEVERSGLLRLAFHQLGGPLTIIRWSLEELEENGPSSIQRTVGNIEEGLKRLNEILKVLSSADLIHAGRLEYKPEFASLTSILKDVVTNAGSRLAIRKQQVTLDLDENITMKLDPKLIAGVTQELLTNAIDFSPDGGKIIVRSRRKGDTAEFEIEDFGYGIPRKDMHRVFGEFARASNATKYKADGNGLGLYIVRGVVQQAGGRVELKSVEGKGTVVTVQLPIVK
jgi:signal transduction histidine kinase